MNSKNVLESKQYPFLQAATLVAGLKVFFICTIANADTICQLTVSIFNRNVYIIAVHGNSSCSNL
jgi:hypothetical protein